MKWTLTICTAFAVIASGIAAQSASSQITRSGDGYLFRMKFAKGAKLVYQMVSVTPQPGGAQDPNRIEGSFTMSILDVVGGVATIKIDSGPFFMDGRSNNQSTSVQIKMDTMGRVVQGDAGAAQFNGIVLPAKPLRIGESFKTTSTRQVPTPNGVKTLTVTSTSTFTGFQTVRNRQAAEIKVQLSASGIVPTTGTALQYLDPKDGQLLVAQIDQQAHQPAAGGNASVVNNRMRIVRK